jgi:Flp pilus assembly protein TadD
MISMKALNNILASVTRRGGSKRGKRSPGLARLAAAALLPAMLAACTGIADEPPADPAVAAEVAKYQPSAEPYRAGSEHFTRGEYAIAEQYFREAVLKAPRNGAAWTALAACYDRLSRFDLADRAYANAIRLSGETALILNNQGYSYMLRGDAATAKIKFAKARALDPENPLVQNNVELLGNSAQYLKRGN